MSDEQPTTTPARSEPTRYRGVWYVVVALFVGTAIFTPIRVAYKNGDTPEGGAGTVVLDNFAFGPTTLPTDAGVAVAFENQDVADHTVTADDGSFDSGVLSPGQTYEIAVDATVTYHCEIHPNMTGTLEVSG